MQCDCEMSIDPEVYDSLHSFGYVIKQQILPIKSRDRYQIYTGKKMTINYFSIFSLKNAVILETLMDLQKLLVKYSKKQWWIL